MRSADKTKAGGVWRHKHLAVGVKKKKMRAKDPVHPYPIQESIWKRLFKVLYARAGGRPEDLEG
jgi:hypothetical protein